jgi:hypothetical protein
MVGGLLSHMGQSGGGQGNGIASLAVGGSGRGEGSSLAALSGGLVGLQALHVAQVSSLFPGGPGIVQGNRC